MTQAAFPREAYERLAPIEAGNFWFEARNALVTWAIGRHFPSASDYLEIGCGTGAVLASVGAAFPRLRLTATDLYPEGMEQARERVPRAEFRQLDAVELEWVEEFDLVGAFDVLEHVADDAQVLVRARRALRPGGGLLLTVPQHPWLWSATDEYAGHRRRYSRAELLEKLRAAGLEPERVTSFVSAPLPLLAAARKGRRRPGAAEFESELNPPPWANRALGAALSAERALIRRGVSLPAGGSLLVVARRPAGG